MIASRSHGCNSHFPLHAAAMAGTPFPFGASQTRVVPRGIASSQSHAGPTTCPARSVLARAGFWPGCPHLPGPLAGLCLSAPPPCSLLPVGPPPTPLCHNRDPVGAPTGSRPRPGASHILCHLRGAVSASGRGAGSERDIGGGEGLRPPGCYQHLGCFSAQEGPSRQQHPCPAPERAVREGVGPARREQ